MQQRLIGKRRVKADVDSWSNFEYASYPVWWNRCACSTLPS